MGGNVMRAYRYVSGVVAGMLLLGSVSAAVPAGAAPGLTWYKNTTSAYAVAYPITWQREPANQSDLLVTSADGLASLSCTTYSDRFLSTPMFPGSPALGTLKNAADFLMRTLGAIRGKPRVTSRTVHGVVFLREDAAVEVSQTATLQAIVLLANRHHHLYIFSIGLTSFGNHHPTVLDVHQAMAIPATIAVAP
jgi:hypothetical protein